MLHLPADLLGQAFGFLDVRTKVGVLSHVCNDEQWRAALRTRAAWTHIVLHNRNGHLTSDAITTLFSRWVPPAAPLSLNITLPRDPLSPQAKQCLKALQQLSTLIVDGSFTSSEAREQHSVEEIIVALTNLQTVKCSCELRLKLGDLASTHCNLREISVSGFDPLTPCVLQGIEDMPSLTELSCDDYPLHRRDIMLLQKCSSQLRRLCCSVDRFPDGMEEAVASLQLPNIHT